MTPSRRRFSTISVAAIALLATVCISLSTSGSFAESSFRALQTPPSTSHAFSPRPVLMACQADTSGDCRAACATGSYARGCDAKTQAQHPEQCGQIKPGNLCYSLCMSDRGC
jgi:hypothetical protein